MNELLARRWREPTITGDRSIYVDRVVIRIPSDAEVRIVNGARGRQFAHVRYNGRVHVLSRLGELDEPEPAMRSRAKKDNWHGLLGEDL